ncbi:MAG: TniQ family protein [Hydrogenophaga sp.]|jgi:hypothetical protein|uniref:TniQ family protein n=1 Tax=Hydrogenophaga sp. TaxID=1904254 RepID=UPI002715CDD5|nr:TniQ family protein [Hydrogenophaga sp.]MDO9569878.1 TniQ family protein [Hydrogenophaga sp.]
MKHPLRIEPMPGEPAVAHQGRVTFLLGIKSGKEFKELVRHCLADEAADVHTLSKLGQLAVIAGMSLADYARQHSMLGVFRVVVLAKNWAPFGSRDDGHDPEYVRNRGMMIHKSQACLCPQCVKEDLDHWKFSWFRRSHQIEGVAWCQSHKIRLQTVTARDPWSKLPQHWVESGEVEDIPGGQEGETEFEARYAEIAMSMLERPAPFHVEALSSVLSERAQSLGLRRSPRGRRTNLSDLLRQTAPSDWLREHWPEVACKAPGDFVMVLDRVVAQRTYAQRGASYLAAMATMWDSTLELHQALLQASAIKPEKKNAAARTQKNSAEFWHGAIWGAYLLCEGHVGRMATVLGIDRTYLGKRLSEFGLVASKRLADSPKRRAFLRFEAGESLRKACEAEKADIDEVEALIRISCARQATAARRIDESRQSIKTVDPDRGQAQGRGRSQVLSAMPASVDCS